VTTHEEAKILGYLREHPTSSVRDILGACLPGAPRPWGQRLIANLEWLGYVTVYYAGDGEPVALQITDRGRHCFGY
jgi:hypothetical protein